MYEDMGSIYHIPVLLENPELSNKENSTHWKLEQTEKNSDISARKKLIPNSNIRHQAYTNTNSKRVHNKEYL